MLSSTPCSSKGSSSCAGAHSICSGWVALTIVSADRRRQDQYEEANIADTSYTGSTDGRSVQLLSSFTFTNDVECWAQTDRPVLSHACAVAVNGHLMSEGTCIHARPVRLVPHVAAATQKFVTRSLLMP